MERSVAARRFGPLAVFAVVLAVLVALAARDDSGRGNGSRDLLPVPLAAGAGARGAEDAAARPSGAMYYGGEIVIPDRLLDGLPTQGPVLDVTAGDTSAARLGALARALGVEGEVRSDEQGWVVGTGDVVLRVFRGPGTHWYLGPDKADRPIVGVGTATAEPAPAPDAPKPSEAPEEPVSDGGSDGDPPVANASDTPCIRDASCVTVAPCPSPPPGAEPACEPYPEPTKPPQPSDDEAKAVAQRVFDAVGLTGAAITINDAWSGKEVVAAPVVAGLPTVGFETRVTVELGGRIQYATGFLGGTDAKGDYPLLAPREAVTRGGAWGPYRAMDLGAPCAPEEPCPTPEPREATRVRLGLTFFSGYDATQAAFLAPAWLLTFEGSTWEEPILALPDQYIATPSPQPGGEDPGSDGGGDKVEPAPATDVPADGGAGSSGSGGAAVEGSTGAPE